MVAPVGSLKDLQKLLDGQDQDIYEKKLFPFYSALLYTPTNGVNQALHTYVSDLHEYEYFHTATGPNWLVAVVEDIRAGHKIDDFKPQDVYAIARYLGAPVDQIPAFVFFTDPKEHKDTLILPLGNSGLVTNEDVKKTIEDVKKLIVKIAAIIDTICADQQVASDKRLTALEKELWKVQLGFKVQVVSSWVGKNFRPFINILDALTKLLTDLHSAGVPL